MQTLLHRWIQTLMQHFVSHICFQNRQNTQTPITRPENALITWMLGRSEFGLRHFYFSRAYTGTAIHAYIFLL
jgi:hypothetical protein